MEAKSGYFLSGDVTLLTLFFAFFFDFWADSVIKLRPNSPSERQISRVVSRDF